MIERTLAQLKEYLKITVKQADHKVKLTSLEIDSRKLQKNSVFLALKGHKVNGHNFIAKALEAGVAAVIVTDSRYQVPQEIKESPRLNSKLLYPPVAVETGVLASWFYGDPTSKLRLLGVTGTNGKSTVTHMLAYLLQSMGKKCAILGTLGYGFLGNLQKSANTTLNAVDLQRALASFLDEGAGWGALEVSSIGVCEGRIEGCHFHGGGFTNLTRDHLDYHKTEEAYFEAKKRFLEMVPPRYLCINDLDKKARMINMAIPGVIAFGEGPRVPAFVDQNYVWIKKIDYLEDGMKLNIVSSYGQGECKLNLLGRFNALNFACALSMLLCHNLPFKALLDGASKIKPVAGRMECYYKQGKPRIIVDYAHTPDGIESALKAVREHLHEKGKVTIVMGCGGDRDVGKRSIMAMKACVYADRVILTNDNPRTENEDQIINDMLLGVPQEYKAVTIEKDRKKAILLAFKEAKACDVVLIAGKGHEDYQIFKDQTVHFSDREIAQSLIANEA